MISMMYFPAESAGVIEGFVVTGTIEDPIFSVVSEIEGDPIVANVQRSQLSQVALTRLLFERTAQMSDEDLAALCKETMHRYGQNRVVFEIMETLKKRT